MVVTRGKEKMLSSNIAKDNSGEGRHSMVEERISNDILQLVEAQRMETLAKEEAARLKKIAEEDDHYEEAKEEEEVAEVEAVEDKGKEPEV